MHALRHTIRRAASSRPFSTALSCRQTPQTPQKPQKPPSFFQNADQQPATHAKLTQQRTTSSNARQTQSQAQAQAPLTVRQLFADGRTRRPVLRLLLALGLVQAAILYKYLSDIALELEDSDNKLHRLWGLYERKTISQSVMAVHIGQLKQQLANVGVTPVTPAQALTLAQHLLQFSRNSDGYMLIYVNSESSIYSKVPFTYEYDIDGVPKLGTAIDDTWETWDAEHSAEDEDEGVDADASDAAGQTPTKRDD